MNKINKAIWTCYYLYATNVPNHQCSIRTGNYSHHATQCLTMIFAVLMALPMSIVAPDVKDAPILRWHLSNSITLSVMQCTFPYNFTWKVCFSCCIWHPFKRSVSTHVPLTRHASFCFRLSSQRTGIACTMMKLLSDLSSRATPIPYGRAVGCLSQVLKNDRDIQRKHSIVCVSSGMRNSIFLGYLPAKLCYKSLHFMQEINQSVIKYL